MSRRPANVTQADIARALRAAKTAGAGAVRIAPDGTIMIELQAPKVDNPQQNDVARNVEFSL